MKAAFALLGVDKRFGGVHAVRDVSLTVERGRVHGLIGPNGAGKTTMVNIAAGLVRPDRGRVELAGRDITTMPVHHRARCGLARTFQTARLFDNLTVRQNLRVALEATGSQRGVEELLGRLRMGDVAEDEARDLPHGRRKLLEVARALARGPDVILLDEPAAGMDVLEAEILIDMVRSYGAGMGVMMIEHRMDVVRALCGELTVVDAGAVLAHGAPDEVLADQAVVQAYLGVS